MNHLIFHFLDNKLSGLCGPGRYAPVHDTKAKLSLTTTSNELTSYYVSETVYFKLDDGCQAPSIIKR